MAFDVDELAIPGLWLVEELLWGDSDAHKLVECAVYQRIDPRSREAVRNAADRDGRRGCAIT